MSPKEQARAVKLLRRWRDFSKAPPVPADDPTAMAQLEELADLFEATDAFLEHEDPDA
jgi:hypothetical protein